MHDQYLVETKNGSAYLFALDEDGNRQVKLLETSNPRYQPDHLDRWMRVHEVSPWPPQLLQPLAFVCPELPTSNGSGALMTSRVIQIEDLREA